MKHRTTRLAALLALLLPAAATAQTAAEILTTAAERHERRVADIDNYTVVQHVAGMRAPVYFEKHMRDGHPVFESRVMAGADMPAVPGGQRQQTVGQADMLVRLSERARLTGTETVDGRTVWVLEADDVSGLGFGDGEFTPTGVTLHLDQEMYVPLRMEMTGTMAVEGESHEVTMITRLEDYREVEGLLHPFRTTITIQGMADAMPAADRAEMQQQMEELRKQLEEMPPEQRRMMEEQMKNMPQMRQMMEQMEAAAAGEDVEMTVEVEEIRVNEGPPGG